MSSRSIRNIEATELAFDRGKYRIRVTCVSIVENANIKWFGGFSFASGAEVGKAKECPPRGGGTISVYGK